MKKVLVAEDDKFLASAYRVKLGKVGFEPVLVTDGNEAIRVLQSGLMPDIILLDLVMPNKDGFATLADIKNNPTWKNIPVIVASNLGQKEDLDKAMALGAVDYIVKSNMTIDGIVEKINGHLGGK